MINRTFTYDDQVAFAKLSGDYNPIHIDPIAARRLIYGSPVVHGIHLVLWALNNFLGQRGRPVNLRSLNVRFRSPVRLEERVLCRLNNNDENSAKISLSNNGQKVADIQLEWSEFFQQNSTPSLSENIPASCSSKMLTADQAATASGSLDLFFSAEFAKEIFPLLVAGLPAMQIAIILATSRLIGMECPGLHSIYSALHLAFDPTVNEIPELTYETVEYDDRFSLLSMRIRAPGAEGTIQAFLRPKPQEQVSFLHLRQVLTNEFSEQRALVVGGSRGLGEVTAKILAAGGAQVRITYFRGRDDARRIVDEISKGGGDVDSLAINVLMNIKDLGERFATTWAPTHLYYFPTPPIFVATKGAFSSMVFRKFCDYYVTGFLNVFRAIRKRNDNLLKVFYPSSVAVEQMPDNMGEYCAAKMAGEALCRFLEKTDRELRIIVSRLPRLATDQTQSLLPVDNLDPLPYMLEELRHVRDA